MVTTKARDICSHCGSHNIFPDDEGKPYCGSCGRPYHDFRDFGRQGGLRTVELYGRERMAEIGQRGGLTSRLPTIEQLRQRKALEAQKQNKNKGGNNHTFPLPNRLSELKELWRQRREEFLAASSSSLGGTDV